MSVIELAISMEKDLEKFYLEQAELNKHNNLKVVFTLLAKEEENHRKILERNSEKLSLSVEDSDILNEVKPLFKDLKNIKSDIKDIPSQLDVYREALGKEEESVKLYKGLLNDSSNQQYKTMFTYLVKQEENHYIILEELIKLLTRPEEWVESAEFGDREDY
ncbi:MAG: ferritin family protein [Clostridiales bacterium]|nr:ferritin family protein [Clostridiales bacterium]